MAKSTRKILKIFFGSWPTGEDQHKFFTSYLTSFGGYYHLFDTNMTPWRRTYVLYCFPLKFFAPDRRSPDIFVKGFVAEGKDLEKKYDICHLQSDTPLFFG